MKTRCLQGVGMRRGQERPIGKGFRLMFTAVEKKIMAE